MCCSSQQVLNPGESKLTKMTLALMRGFGWYNVSDAVAEDTYWGSGIAVMKMNQSA
jgi:hypothetical protein